MLRGVGVNASKNLYSLLYLCLHCISLCQWREQSAHRTRHFWPMNTNLGTIWRSVFPTQIDQHIESIYILPVTAHSFIDGLIDRYASAEIDEYVVISASKDQRVVSMREIVENQA